MTLAGRVIKQCINIHALVEDADDAQFRTRDAVEYDMRTREQFSIAGTDCITVRAAMRVFR